jgi:hypothetical protein
MGRLSAWRGSRENVSLSKFCKKDDTCPKCESDLECQQERQNTIKVCPNCDYVSSE